MDRQFWYAKRVFITGHNGFKGSWLSAWLETMGAIVVGYSLVPRRRPNMFEAAHIGANIESIEGDVRDLVDLTNAMQAKAPEIVIHMAAQALVKTAYGDPVTTYATNVMGTVNVLEAVRHTDSVRVLIAVSSDKCYENLEHGSGYRESDPMGGDDPYSSSKGCAELVISAYGKSYFHNDQFQNHGVRLASVRAGNVIGGGDWARDRLVPDIMKCLLAKKPVPIRRPHAVRPWQFVLEPLRGYLDLAERLWNDGAEFVGAWNFGPNIEHVQPVQRIVDLVTERWGGGARWVLDETEHPHENDFLALDCTKAKTRLGWQPIIELPTVIDWVVDWYRAFADKQDLRALTENQIREYEALIANENN